LQRTIPIVRVRSHLCTARAIGIVRSVRSAPYPYLTMKVSPDPLSIFPAGLSRLALGCVALAAILAVSATAGAQPLSDTALHQIQAMQDEKASFTPAQQKMDSQLIFALKKSRGQTIANGAVPQLRIGAAADTNGMIQVDINANVTSNLLQQIQNLGGTVISSFPQFSALRVSIPLTNAENIAAAADLKFIRPAVPALANNSDPEGVVVHRDNVARQVFNVDGTGVKIGVLSDSVDFLAQAQAAGDLGPVTVLPGQGGTGAGEGTAMLEIVHAMAPGAQLFFATGFNGQPSMANNILALRFTYGCDIIVDDVSYFDESPFQDAIIARAVDAVTVSGGLYFSSAANSGNLDSGASGTWEGDFVNGGAVAAPVNGKGGFVHSFGTVNYDTANQQGFAAVLLWSDPLGASTNDYDLYILDSTGANIVGSSVTVQNGTQDPVEMILPGANKGERIVVVQATGTNRFLHIDTERGQLAIGTQGSTRGHNAPTNGFCVAAVDIHTAYPNPFTGGPANPVEFFSSDGPRQMFYLPNGTPYTPGNFSSSGGVIFQKPDITAADGVTTSVPGFAPFFGTSAAAPHAAAIAGLLLSYNPFLTAAQVRTLLTSTALDIMAPGVDRDSGYGIVMPDLALAAAPPPNIARLILVTNIVSGGNGNGVIDNNECNDLFLVITNASSTGATNISVTITSTNANVFIPQPTSAFPDMPGGTLASNLVAFRISTTPDFICGTPINLAVAVKFTAGGFTNTLVLSTGTNGLPVRYDNFQPAAIPPASAQGTNSSILVTNLSGAVQNVSVSLYLTDPFDASLILLLTGPDGTTTTLSSQNGGAGQNYGLACFPDGNRTTFDDAAGTPIASGRPPFAGSFVPDQPLAVFAGKSGTNANGLWHLNVSDRFGFAGTLQCWSLFISSAGCTDGGGQCPGVDLAIGMLDAPDPALIGSNLVYTISVTNNGPGIAHGVAVTQNLPSSVLFVSASVSQGGVSESGGVVTCTLGNLGVGATATATVTVVPLISGQIFSSATVASSDPELNPLNNAVTVSTLVTPPVADMAVGLVSSPNPTVVGAPFTYTLSVTNNGPAFASGVVVTSTLPTSLQINSFDHSQGSLVFVGNTAIFNVGLLGKSATATATINVTPQAFGIFSATAVVSAIQPDPFLANNTATAITTVAQAADLSITLGARPNPVVIGSNLTYLITVTNKGPSTATNVIVNQTLPVGVSVISNFTSQGTLTLNGSTLTGNLGTIVAGGNATIVVLVTTTRQGSLTSTATVTASQADLNPADNSATVTAIVSAPFLNIVPAGVSLTFESFSPPDGAIDAGETNTIQFRLQNAGNVANTNLIVTLLTNGGIIPLTGPQVYGILKPIGIPGAVPVSRPFMFYNNGVNGGTLTATLAIQDAGGYTTNAVFTFALPNLAGFANTNTIIIPDHGIATNYPSVIAVSGMAGQIARVTATLNGFSHTFPQDVSALLVGPTGVKTLLISHATDQGFSPPAPAFTLTFDDLAPAPLPASGQLSSGSWQVSDYPPAVIFSNPAPAGPYATALSAFNGVNPNGNWSLYVLDDSPGDAGTIANGWSLSLTSVSPVNQIADLGLAMSALPNPVFVGDYLTNNFVISNAGPSTASGVLFSNALPQTADVVVITNSQGNVITNGGLLLANLFSLPAGATASVSVVLKPNSPGLLTNSASVSAFETDLHTGDNSATTVNTVILPQASLALAVAAAPNPVTVGSNLTYSISVTNNGPGKALKVVATDPIPAAASYVSALASPGSASFASGVVTANFGDLVSNATSTLTLVVTPNSAGPLTNLVSVSTTSSNISSPNATLPSVVTVVNPAPAISPVGAVLLSEGNQPPNGAVDPNETVTVSLSLANTGLVDTVSLGATLLITNGVGSASVSSNNYGALVHGGPAASRAFTFTAGAPANGLVIATLMLQDGSKPLGTVGFTFVLPVTSTVVLNHSISIPDHGPATPYPVATNISGMTGYVGKVSVTLYGVSHSFASDVNVLLVGPGNHNALLMSHAGSGYGLNNVKLTFDDAGAALPSAAPIPTGTYKPSRYAGSVAFPSPAPAAPYGSALSALNGIDPNGTWALYVLDDSAGDSGVITGGWSLTITTIVPVSPLADLAVGMSGSANSIFVGNVVTYTINVTNLGPADAPGVVLTDPLPAGFNIVSYFSTAGSISLFNGLLTSSLGTLTAGSKATITVVAAPPLAGTFVNTATVSGACTDLVPGNNSVQVNTGVFSPVPPRLTGVVSNGLLHLTVNAQFGLTYVIQASTNLAVSGWVPISTNVAALDGTVHYTDPSTATFKTRYYRAVRQLP
jgi:uncharacterized repeat protein (TIGR01451 family)